MLCDLKTVENDLLIENGDLALVSGGEELTQLLLTRLQWFYGEYSFDTTKGVRFFEDIFVKNPNIPNIETLLKKIISETDGVNKVLFFNFKYSAVERTAELYFDVDTVYGNIEQSISMGA